jgi:hypothetical protein
MVGITPYSMRYDPAEFRGGNTWWIRPEGVWYSTTPDKGYLSAPFYQQINGKAAASCHPPYSQFRPKNNQCISHFFRVLHFQKLLPRQLN